MRESRADRFPPEEVEQARRRTLYLAASLRQKGCLPATVAVSAGDPPSLSYLRRYVQLVHLLTHGQRLLGEVLPRIRQWLAPTTVRQQETRLQARGVVDWQATLRRSWGRGETEPGRFVSTRPARDYATSGNRLTALTLLATQQDVHKLLADIGGKLTREEVARLRALVAGAERELRLPQLRAATAELEDELLRDPHGPAARRLEDDVEWQARRTPPSSTGYLLLVAWRRTWLSWLTGVADIALDAPVWQAADHDLYELLVLLEVASAFARRSRIAEQTRGRGEYRTSMFEFVLDDGRPLHLWFQSMTALERYMEVVSRPDLVMVLDGRAVVFEVKSFRNPSGGSDDRYTSALNEVMAYLFNYGYGDPGRWHTLRGGVAVFPYPAGTRHPGYRHLSTERPGRCWIASLIVPFTGADAACIRHLDQLVDDLLR